MRASCPNSTSSPPCTGALPAAPPAARAGAYLLLQLEDAVDQSLVFLGEPRRFPPLRLQSRQKRVAVQTRVLGCGETSVTGLDRDHDVLPDVGRFGDPSYPSAPAPSAPATRNLSSTAPPPAPASSAPPPASCSSRPVLAILR